MLALNVNEVGAIIDVIGQPPKIDLPIVFTLLGITIIVRPEPTKARSPMITLIMMTMTMMIVILSTDLLMRHWVG
jgi:hypothetical protein